MKENIRYMDILVIDKSLDRWRKNRKGFPRWNNTVNAKAYMKFRTKPELIPRGEMPTNVFVRTEVVPGHTKRYDGIFVYHDAPEELRASLKPLLKDENKDVMELKPETEAVKA